MTHEQVSLPPVGWYPNPATGQPGYWNGTEWAEPPAANTRGQSGERERLVAADAVPLGLTNQQDIVEVDVPAHLGDRLSDHIREVLATKPAHRIVTMTMAAYGEFPLAYRVLITIEFLSAEPTPQKGA